MKKTTLCCFAVFEVVGAEFENEKCIKKSAKRLKQNLPKHLRMVELPSEDIVFFGN